MNEAVECGDKKTGNLFWPAVVGVFFGVLFSFAPFELLVLGVPLALAVGFLFCLSPGRSYRLKGYLPAVGFAVVMMIAAALLPTKEFDKPVVALPTTEISVDDLVRLGLAYEPAEPAWAQVRMVLPSIQPTRMEILKCINQQTSLRASIFRCGNGATLVWGGSFGKISVHPKVTAVATSNL